MLAAVTGWPQWPQYIGSYVWDNGLRSRIVSENVRECVQNTCKMVEVVEYIMFPYTKFLVSLLRRKD